MLGGEVGVRGFWTPAVLKEDERRALLPKPGRRQALLLKMEGGRTASLLIQAGEELAKMSGFWTPAGDS